MVAVVAVGLLWIRARMGFDLTSDRIARGVWIAVGILASIIVWGLISLARGHVSWAPLAAPPPPAAVTRWLAFDTVLVYVLGFALAIPTIGGGDAVARAAHELRPPRLQALQRTSLLVSMFTGLVTVSGAFLFVLLVPAADQTLWTNAPLAGLAQHLAGPAWARDIIAVALVGAAVLLLLPAAHFALSDAEQLLQRLSIEGSLSERLAFLHTKFGTPSRAIDVAVAAAILVMFVSAGRVTWLAHAYAVAIVATLALKIAALVRLRRLRPAARPFQAPLNLHVGTREIPLGLFAATLLAGAAALALIVSRDPAAIATIALIGQPARALHGRPPRQRAGGHRRRL